MSSGEKGEEFSQGRSGNEEGRGTGNVMSQSHRDNQQPGCTENQKDENIPPPAPSDIKSHWAIFFSKGEPQSDICCL